MSPRWIPGRDSRAVRHSAAPGSPTAAEPRSAVVVGGGIAGIAAAVALAERGVQVVLVEKHDQLGGRVRSWPVDGAAGEVTMSRGFHAFFRQYYNLRALIRRVDPTLAGLTAVADYPMVLADGGADSFGQIPRTPPLNLAAFVAKSPNFSAGDLVKTDIGAALELLDVQFPATFAAYDGESAAQVLDRLRFPDRVRHLALEVFARSFFARPDEFSGGELVAMFHLYFLGSSEGLTFDVPIDDYDTVLWAPLRDYLDRIGVRVVTGRAVAGIDIQDGSGVEVSLSNHNGDDHETSAVSRSDVLSADAVVLATDLATTRCLVAGAPLLGDADWRQRIADTRSAPRFAVWRLWLDRKVHSDRQEFLGTSGFGLLDNVTVLERFEAGARRWSEEHGGSVVELHAYALPDQGTDEQWQHQLRDQLGHVYPETVAAQVVSTQWLVSDDCPLVGTGPWERRPEVKTPDPRVVLAGDGVRCDLPVALMERAATTGFLAANALLDGWGVAGHDVWTVPMRGRIGAVRGLRRMLGYSPGSPRVRSRYRRSA